MLAHAKHRNRWNGLLHSFQILTDHCMECKRVSSETLKRDAHVTVLMFGINRRSALRLLRYTYDGWKWNARSLAKAQDLKLRSSLELCNHAFETIRHFVSYQRRLQHTRRLIHFRTSRRITVKHLVAWMRFDYISKAQHSGSAQHDHLCLLVLSRAENKTVATQLLFLRLSFRVLVDHCRWSRGLFCRVATFIWGRSSKTQAYMVMDWQLVCKARQKSIKIMCNKFKGNAALSE